ncbi:hypothetical protein [Nocardia carnea]|uniref:hypothetical protein n=1 Tax=Nocardia carnea TaxID=37328 RepID=UPI0012DF6C31|nr:hypothetical protein [Nocardia carnea]
MSSPFVAWRTFSLGCAYLVRRVDVADVPGTWLTSRMAQPHLGDRVQIRYRAPKVIVDALMLSQAVKDGIPFSQVVSGLLAELTGYPQVGSPMILFEIPHPTAFRPDPDPAATSWLKCRVPTQVHNRLTAMAREENIPAGPGQQARNRMITRLLARRLGYMIDSSQGGCASPRERLLLTGRHDVKRALAEAS